MLDTLVREFAVALYAAIFSLLAIRAMLDWRRRLDRSSLWFSVAFGTLAAAIIMSIPFQLLSDAPPPAIVTALIVLLITCHPPALLRFAASFGSIGRVEQAAVNVVFLVLAVSIVVLEFPDPGTRGSDAFVAFTFVFVVAWSIVTIRVTISLWFSSRDRPGIVRGRMRLLAFGVVALNAALLLSVADPEGEHGLVTAIVTVASAVLLFAGFTPFEWLRVLMRHSEQQQLRAAVSGLVAVSREEQLFEALLPATRDVIGVHAIAIFHDGIDEPLTLGYEDDDIEQIRLLLDGLPVDASRSLLVDGRLIRRDADSWIIINAPSGGEFFGSDELEVLASINSIAGMIRVRLRDAERVLEHEQRLQTAIDLAGLGKWEWRVGSAEVMWSPGQRRIFGVDEDQTITYERYQAMIAPADSERVAATVAAALESADTYEVDHGIVRSDGTEIFVNSRALITRASDGEATRIFGVTMDITSRVQAERELRRAVEAEREVAARLREVDELKTSILSAVSHELRTPLTSVHGLGVVLQDQIEQLEPARRREIVDHIVTESERLGSLLSDLLDLDRLRRGVIVPQRTSVDVGRLIRGVVETRDRPEQFELQLDDFTFELDGPKFERIVENLVMNAEKYAGHGAHVVVRTTLVGDELQLCVEDDGPGVPDQLHESIFEAFNRRDAELGFAPGTGIGLSLVKRFAQLHGGTARVEAGARGGAAFIVSIPQRGAFDEPNIIAG